MKLYRDLTPQVFAEDKTLLPDCHRSDFYGWVANRMVAASSVTGQVIDCETREVLFSVSPEFIFAKFNSRYMVIMYCSRIEVYDLDEDPVIICDFEEDTDEKQIENFRDFLLTEKHLFMLSEIRTSEDERSMHLFRYDIVNCADVLVDFKIISDLENMDDVKDRGRFNNMKICGTNLIVHMNQRDWVFDLSALEF